jgi:hypothetical protein
MSHQTIVKSMQAECAWCGKGVPVTNDGKLYRHRDTRTGGYRPRNHYCIASRKTLAQADTYRNWIDFLYKHFQAGDAIPVSTAMLNSSPAEGIRDHVTYVTPEIPEGLTIEAELAFLVQHARDYIARMRDLLFEEDWTA